MFVCVEIDSYPCNYVIKRHVAVTYLLWLELRDWHGSCLHDPIVAETLVASVYGRLVIYFFLTRQVHLAGTSSTCFQQPFK